MVEGYDFECTERELGSIGFYPELKYDLFFTNIPGLTVPRQRDPERSSPFLRLTAPFHMLYTLPSDFDLNGNTRLLHYIRYSEEVIRGGELEKQPSTFLALARQAREWLNQHYVSLRGRNTADNLDEYLRLKSYLPGSPS